jgi:competence ComEA-like helix-hairpin-helix protein
LGGKQLLGAAADNRGMSRGCVLTLMFMLGLIPAARAQKPMLEGVVNINTASPDELRLLTGVGPARIRNILAYRHKHPFRTVEELARIKGIGRKMVRHLRLHLAVTGPTTAQKTIRPVAPVVSPPVSAPAARPRPQPALGSRPSPRKGDPLHQAIVSSRGSSCLPPP